MASSQDQREEELQVLMNIVIFFFLSSSVDHVYIACILLGLFWLFLFRFRNNKIHGISSSKRTLLDLENGIPVEEVTWELPCLPGTIGESGRVGIPAKNFLKERVFCLFRVDRIPSILFILLSGAE